jgi:hypothetical protein
MIEAKIRVEKTTTNKFKTCYYGNVTEKYVTENIIFRDFDKRGCTIAPMGIKATLSVQNIDSIGEVYEINVYDITINRYYLDYLDTDNGLMEYYCHFSIDGRIYQFNLYIDCETKKIKSYDIEEWYNEGEFEDGECANNVYHKGDKEFIAFTEYIC